MTGITLTLVALAADLGGTGTVLVFVAGVTLAGIGLGAVDSLPLRSHQALDRTLVVLLGAGAVVSAAAGSAPAALILLAAAAGVLLLETRTHWSRPMAG